MASIKKIAAATALAFILLATGAAGVSLQLTVSEADYDGEHVHKHIDSSN